ncbi:arf-GAP with Rho-GAP domain, ANK repeat and PH domain-containing protein 3 isoform X3 [Alligator sinensis]|uniref:Arf-GAP with Rho-GAP domain, ANK repeat and PH domain-containing protein 3 isoform X3 n=1 Tax=Alligator sinensis TaxID=38654 RepID=A0A3Q0HMS7_ALLSI|nr:arf-GAP with Rho-GAP domain, ANK repeat and PH domain-containing protein 3 isoform X3 [Alligator sinensis]
MISQYSADSDIADWLSIIHLERYQDVFKKHGYYVARDAVFLDNENLQLIGITATGHRKRILNLVQQTLVLVEGKFGPMAGDAHAKPGTYTEPLDAPRVYQIGETKNGSSIAKGAAGAAVDRVGNKQHSAGLSQDPTMEKEPVPPLTKPVPKPRTIFYCPSPAAKSEQDPVPKPLAQSIVPTHKPGSDGNPGSFVRLEGFMPGETSTVLKNSKLTPEQPGRTGEKSSKDVVAPSIGVRKSALEPTPENETGLSEMGLANEGEPENSSPPIPSVPPRLGHKGQLIESSPASLTESCPAGSSSLPVAATLATSTQGEPLLCPSASSQPALVHSRLEMVSNVLYEGLNPLLEPAGCSGGEEVMEKQTTTQLPGLATKEVAPSSEKPESPRCPYLSLPPIPQRPVSRPDLTEEPISPYCESVFGTGLSTGQGYKVVPQKFPDLKQEGSRRSSECSSEGRSEDEESRAQLINRIIQNDTEGYSTVEAPQAEGSQFSLPLHLYPDEVLDDLTISPYASYTSLSEKPPTMLSGWLDKLSPQGNYVFQRRYVRFDGKNLMYFNSEKDPYPKGVIPLSVIEMARSTKENMLQVVPSHRIFVFRAENEAQRNEWCSTMQKKVAEQRQVSSRPRHTSNSHWQKSGCLEFKGHKSKVFAVLSLAEMWLYKSEQFFKMGIGICLIELRGATIREAKHRSFELITPFKIFSFTAESEREKREWMEALQDAIAETLYDYEVAEKIWSNKANKFCADCRAMSPDWASINLCVVICKQCAGQHRGLGSNISKVQSLKLDTSVWSNEIVQLFIVLGNERANQFWSPHIPPSEALYPDASAEQRREFITCKYRDGRYRLQHPSYSTQEELLQTLCAAVAGPNLLKTVLQFFSTAEAEAAFDVGGCDVSQGVELWQMSESSCHGNNSVCSAGSHSSVEPSLDSVYNEITQPVMHSGYLYKAAALPRSGVSKKSRDEFCRVWCSLEKSLLFYETDKCTEPLGKIEMADMVSVGVSKMEGPTSPGPTERFRFTLDLFLGSEKVQQLGADGPDTLQAWASAIGKWFTPVSCHCLLGYEFQKAGQLRYKSMLNPDQWLQGFFILQKAHLFICPVEEKAAEDSINLRRLQELSVVPLSETSEKKEMLILVEMGRTFYLQGVSRVDFAAWCMDIQASAGGWGNALRDQQLSRSNIPIIVDSCIAFITQYGLRHEGIYRKNGAKSRIKVLMEEFRRDARNVKLRISDNFIEDVTDVLKRFFRELEDPVFTSELHPQWKEAAEIPQKAQRLERYKELINHLPRLNRKTLAALIGHLYRVQKCADFNQMGTKNLSLLFAPSLFQTDGKGEHEVKVMEDLIDNYVRIFNIDEDQVSQMDLENSLITTWKDVQLSQAGDLIIEVYLEQKLLDCCVTLKVSPSMTAEELTNQVLEMRSVAASLDIWLTFEALENGELERPLHPKEKVLEQALQWCKLPEPSSAYLLVRKVPIGEGGCLFTGAKRESPKCGLLKCREEHPKLLGSKFQERYFVIRDQKLLLLKEKRSAKPEREWPLDSAKVYMGIRKKLKPPSQWGFTLTLDKQQLYLACTGQAELWDWITSILKAQHDDLRSVILRRRSSSDLSKQKFGTMPLVPLRGDSTDTTMLSANQTLRRLHNRRTLSMFFPLISLPCQPMKMHQDSLDEQQEKEAADAEPVYEEVGNCPTLSPLELDRGLLAALSQVPAVDRSVKPTLFSEQSQHPALRSSLPPSPGQKVSSMPFTKALSLERGLNLESEKALYHTRSSGLRPTKTASLERNLEPSQVLPALAQEQEAEQKQPLVLEPLFGKAPPPEASKKISHLPSPINDKLMQELSSVILRKNEGQGPELGPGQQIT